MEYFCVVYHRMCHKSLFFLDIHTSFVNMQGKAKGQVRFSMVFHERVIPILYQIHRKCSGGRFITLLNIQRIPCILIGCIFYGMV